MKNQVLRFSAALRKGVQVSPVSPMSGNATTGRCTSRETALFTSSRDRDRVGESRSLEIIHFLVRVQISKVVVVGVEW